MGLVSLSERPALGSPLQAEAVSAAVGGRGMGLLTVIKSVKAKEREMRILMVYVCPLARLRCILFCYRPLVRQRRSCALTRALPPRVRPP